MVVADAVRSRISLSDLKRVFKEFGDFIGPNRSYSPIKDEHVRDHLYCDVASVEFDLYHHNYVGNLEIAGSKNFSQETIYAPNTIMGIVAERIAKKYGVNFSGS